MASSVGSAVIFGTIFFRVGLTQAAVQSRIGLMQARAGIAHPLSHLAA